MIKDQFKNEGFCYQLACESHGEISLKMKPDETSYCFKKQEYYKEGIDTCNPFSDAKFER